VVSYGTFSLLQSPYDHFFPFRSGPLIIYHYTQLTLTRKIPYRLSPSQKARQRKRLRLVDAVISTVDKALARQGLTTKSVERWKEEMPREEEMLPKDKYSIFDRKEKTYRKGVHSEYILSCLMPN
jgi:hypothetical protein